MESSRSTSLVAANIARLAQVSEGHMDAPVPTCPEWTVRDLILHLVLVYRHKTECMRHGQAPSDWPPEIDVHISPLTQLRAAMADMLAEMTARGPHSHAYTWYGPDQTVGFWIRRMVHETVIHRVDAELAVGAPVHEISDEIAADGIDELLTIFCDWSSRQWIDELSGLLDELGTATIGIEAADTGWTVAVRPDGITVEHEQREDVDVAVIAEPSPMLLWLWRRIPQDGIAVPDEAASDNTQQAGAATARKGVAVLSDGVTVKGESAAVDKFRRLLETMTQ
ncbi:MAG TPA: maleylpyruvate isomerase family mycothiol-dependent enzyme [Candidatus Stackebrandtia faecavium]|nr:maleylpyruvate isomerase family mycothiol-dependent enzyme [Candidatus Stackebrandtia faecavium]